MHIRAKLLMYLNSLHMRPTKNKVHLGSTKWFRPIQTLSLFRESTRILYKRLSKYLIRKMPPSLPELESRVLLAETILIGYIIHCLRIV